MTRQEAKRIVQQSTFPRSSHLDGMVETLEARDIIIGGLEPWQARLVQNIDGPHSLPHKECGDDGRVDDLEAQIERHLRTGHSIKRRR